MNLIKLLKQNEKPFGLMSEEMQAKAVELGFHGNFQLYSDFQLYSGYGSDGGFGAIIDNPDYGYNRKLTYRLRPDYQEEPEIVECEIYEKDSHVQGCYTKAYDFGDQRGLGLAQYPNGYKRIGFKFEDGCMRTTPVYYQLESYTNDQVRIEDDHTVLHATHVLFRRQK